jgi:hypothetical protein
MPTANVGAAPDGLDHRGNDSQGQAAAPAMAWQESAQVRHISVNFISCASSEAAHISAHIMHIRVHSWHMSRCIGDIRHIMSAHIFDISAQSIIIRIIAASICPGWFRQYVMVSSHVMEHDMQSSTASRMSLLIETV